MSGCAAERDLVFGEISRERIEQDLQWGGSAHDDSHELFEWCEYIRKQNNYAVNRASSQDPIGFEARLLKVAALAIAAIESSRRQRAATPGPRNRLADPNNWALVYSEDRDEHLWAYIGPEAQPWMMAWTAQSKTIRSEA